MKIKEKITEEQIARVTEKLRGEAIVFFRIGKFYRLFFVNAWQFEVLPIIKDLIFIESDKFVLLNSLSVDSFLPRLVRAGYKVAICENLNNLK